MAMVFGMAVILVGVAWSPFLLTTRTLQVDVAPIIASSPVRPLPMPAIKLMPPQRRARGEFSQAGLWGEPQSLFREYAPVMRGYQATFRLGLD